MTPTPTPTRYAVIGNPINHSKSPLIHNTFAQETGQALVYEAIEGPLGQFAATVDRFRAEGGQGMNVTVPFKLDACAYATELSESAKAAGAANAMRFTGDRCEVENFDGVGLVRDITHNLGHAVQGRRVLVLGAGGATRGAIWPLLQQGPARLLVVNRTVAKAETLVAGFVAQGADSQVLEAGGYGDLGRETFDVVINATSASLTAELPPVPARLFTADSLAYDMVYGKKLTPFLQLAHQTGVRHLADGVGMLVEQAAEAFAWWRGVRPPTQQMIHRISVPLF